MKSLLALLLTLAAFSGQAQTGTLEGSIVDASGNMLTSVDLILEGTSLGIATDAWGKFRLEGIPTGEYILKASSVGFKTYTLPVKVEGKKLSILLVLLEASTELPEIIINRETMTGSSHLLTDIPGSAHYLGPRQLDKFNYNDINRVLRNIPGINIQEEEGFGLRPNIGMRGTGVERSTKITLMEDGILAAPAPYVAPAAYYFPTAGRMNGVEVRKGSSQIKYGPYTTGGAINFISTPIPSEFAARINLMGGNFGRRIVHASAGQSFDHGGFMVETYQNSSTGFKHLDTGGPTGFDNQDYLGKLFLKTRPDAKVHQSLLLKVGQSIGKADETYLGLTQADFDATPFRRYAGSQVDNITTSQEQYSLKYSLVPAKFLDISVTAYRNVFSRNWYKVYGTKFDPAADPAARPVSITNILEDPAVYSNEYAILTGATSPNDDALFVRNNNRKYYAQGIQGILGFNFKSDAINHDIELGFRYHEDEEDRFQSDDEFKMENGKMVPTKYGLPGSEDNRVSHATAYAGYVQYSLKFGKFIALPGLRYENMLLSRLNYGKNDPQRTGAAVTKTANQVDVWVPGIGLEYALRKDLSGFLGIHRGFAPPGATEGTNPESSINYELGGRLNRPNLNAQATVFYNNYQNLLGTDLAAAGGGGTGDLFNAGKARTYGLEMQLDYNWMPANVPFTVPITLGYTYTQGEFLSSFTAVNEDWGTVQVGDQFPYLSNYQITGNLGLEHRIFRINLSTKYLSQMRTAPGQGDIPLNQKINSNFIIDLSINYKASRWVTFIGTVNNITNEVYAVARRPSGIRPGLPLAVLLGIKVNL